MLETDPVGGVLGRCRTEVEALGEEVLIERNVGARRVDVSLGKIHIKILSVGYCRACMKHTVVKSHFAKTDVYEIFRRAGTAVEANRARYLIPLNHNVSVAVFGRNLVLAEHTLCDAIDAALDMVKVVSASVCRKLARDRAEFNVLDQGGGSGEFLCIAYFVLFVIGVY